MILALSAGRDSPADLRARLALDENGQREVLRAPRTGVGELAILCTCHRTELYATADGLGADAVHVMAGLLPGLRPTDQHDLRFYDGSEAVEHLFRVACGLDSMVVGEAQVLGQVRRAYVLAQEEGSAGPVLSNIMSRALRLGKQARSDTSLGALSKSIGSIAADHLAQAAGGLEGRIGVVVGAGVAASDAAVSLQAGGAHLIILSRHESSAARLATQVNGEARPLADLPRVLEKADFAVVAVAGGPLLEISSIAGRGPDHPLHVLDLSVPRAVTDGSSRRDVTVSALDEIPGPHGPQGPEVTTAMIDAEALVKKAVAELERWLDTRSSGPAIRDLRNRAEMVVREEVARTLAGMHLSPDDQNRVAALAMRIANKLLHGPTAALREADEPTRETIQRLFGLET